MLELTQTANGRNALALPSTLDHGDLTHLKTTLMNAVEQGLPLDVDASAVRKITTQAAQLLVAARAAGKDRDAAWLQIVSPSSSFSEFAATLALEEELGLTEISR